jgi:hypothetical protein
MYTRREFGNKATRDANTQGRAFVGEPIESVGLWVTAGSWLPAGDACNINR